MSDVTGRDALEMILDRMDDKTTLAGRYERERDDVRRELVDTQRRIQQLERELLNLRAAPVVNRASAPETDPF